MPWPTYTGTSSQSLTRDGCWRLAVVNCTLSDPTPTPDGGLRLLSVPDLGASPRHGTRLGTRLASARHRNRSRCCDWRCGSGAWCPLRITKSRPSASEGGSSSSSREGWREAKLAHQVGGKAACSSPRAGSEDMAAVANWPRLGHGQLGHFAIVFARKGRRMLCLRCLAGLL